MFFIKVSDYSMPHTGVLVTVCLQFMRTGQTFAKLSYEEIPLQVLGQKHFVCPILYDTDRIRIQVMEIYLYIQSNFTDII